jgi:hypothetical protein
MPSFSAATQVVRGIAARRSRAVQRLRPSTLRSLRALQGCSPSARPDATLPARLLWCCRVEVRGFVRHHPGTVQCGWSASETCTGLSAMLLGRGQDALRVWQRAGSVCENARIDATPDAGGTSRTVEVREGTSSNWA